MRYLWAIYTKTGGKSKSKNPTIAGFVATYKKVTGLFSVTYPIIGTVFFKYLLFGERRVLEANAPFLGPFYLRASTSDLAVFREIALGLYTVPAEILYALKQRKNSLIVIDCGANVGYATMRLLRVLSSSNVPVKKVLCIEPNKENFKILELNINRLKVSFSNVDIELINGAVMDKNCAVSITGDAYSWCSALENAYGDTKGISIEDLVARNLENITSNLGLRRILMKIDIEGGEIRLFRNSTIWLDEVAVLFVERHDQLGYAFEESLKIIEAKGFILWKKDGHLSNDLLFVHSSVFPSE